MLGFLSVVTTTTYSLKKLSKLFLLFKLYNLWLTIQRSFPIFSLSKGRIWSFLRRWPGSWEKSFLFSKFYFEHQRTTLGRRGRGLRTCQRPGRSVVPSSTIRYTTIGYWATHIAWLLIVKIFTIYKIKKASQLISAKNNHLAHTVWKCKEKIYSDFTFLMHFCRLFNFS